MIERVSAAIVLLAALYLLGLAAISFIAPHRAARFLNGFASSPRVHFSEMLLRLIVGCAFVMNASRMLYSEAFWLFGWLLIVTTVVLLLLPWRWHHRFAQKVVPPITRHVWLFGIVSLPLGGAILFAVLRGGAL
jgi:hypothetical protein